MTTILNRLSSYTVTCVLLNTVLYCTQYTVGTGRHLVRPAAVQCASSVRWLTMPHPGGCEILQRLMRPPPTKGYGRLLGQSVFGKADDQFIVGICLSISSVGSYLLLSVLCRGRWMLSPVYIILLRLQVMTKDDTG